MDDLQKLQAHVDHWQPIFHLQDWDIKCVILDADDLRGSVGRHQANHEKHNARIISIPDADRCDLDLTMEQTAIHELLHLYFTVPEDEYYRVIGEQGLNMLAVLLSEQRTNNV